MFTKRFISITIGVLTFMSLLHYGEEARAFNLRNAAEDTISIGLAYTTHLFFHELGHQLIADEVGAEAHQMNFFTFKDGKFYPGLSTYEDIPTESILPYAAGGDRMAGFTFEYAFSSFLRKPSTFNKALMFFSGVDFVVYTILANYVNPHNDMYDPNIIRKESGSSKEVLLGMVMAKSLINAYRVFNKETNFVPMITVNNESAAFSIRINF